jgi:hypothetical protein
MLRQPISATFTLSEGANSDDQTFSGTTDNELIADAAIADFLRKFLLEGFILFLFSYYYFLY